MYSLSLFGEAALGKYNIIELWVHGFFLTFFGETELLFVEGVDFFDDFFLGRPRLRFAQTTRKWRFIEFLFFGVGVVLRFLLLRHASI